MRLISFAILAVLLLSSCSAVSAAPVMLPSTMEVDWFDPHDLDCLPHDVKIELARGMLRADDLVARCRIDREVDQKVFHSQLSELKIQVAGLAQQAMMFKITLAAAIVAGIIAAASTIIGIIK